MSDKFYYYSFAYLAYGKDQEEWEEKDRVHLICMTDVVIEGDSPEILNETIQKIATEAYKKGFVVCHEPQPTFTKRTKRDILAFLEKEKKAIKRAEQDKRKAKAVAKKAEPKIIDKTTGFDIMGGGKVSEEAVEKGVSQILEKEDKRILEKVKNSV